MNTMKVPVAVAVALMMVAGCGPKKEEYPALPPEQILSGNAILAPQSVTLEAQTITASPLTSAAVAPVAMETTSLELTATAVTDKPTNKDIQQALKNAGVYSGSIDGTLGPKSKQAIRDFQTQNGLNADGKVGPKTWKRLSAYLLGAPAETQEAAAISD